MDKTGQRRAGSKRSAQASQVVELVPFISCMTVDTPFT
jgi:hypothetical protein